MGNGQNLTMEKVHAKMNEQAIHFSKNILFDVQQIQFPLSTKGIKIVDETGRRVKLAGGNWSGGHMERHCVDGLQCRPLADLCHQIRHKFDMNCVRLTFSLQLFYDNNIIDKKYLTANPHLIGKTAMQIFDITVQELTKAGIMVILNNHTSKSQWCCSPFDGDGLWWNQQYPQHKFFQCLVAFAHRYKKNPRVIGMDLRNELRRMSNLVGPTWGDKNPKTDWHMCATIIGNQLLSIAPHWLIFVSGLHYQLEFKEAVQFPIQFKVPNKLVYTGHFYGFSWPLTFWSLTSYESYKQKMIDDMLHVRGIGNGVPFLLGQFGNNTQDIPWEYLMRLLRQTDLDWTYWCLDGFKCKNQEDETFGIWTNDFKQIRNPVILKDIQAVGRPKKEQNLVRKLSSRQVSLKTNITNNNFRIPQPINIQRNSNRMLNSINSQGLNQSNSYRFVQEPIYTNRSSNYNRSQQHKIIQNNMNTNRVQQLKYVQINPNSYNNQQLQNFQNNSYRVQQPQYNQLNTNLYKNQQPPKFQNSIYRVQQPQYSQYQYKKNNANYPEFILDK